jgi:putative component of membrane protein insertase Oxa1/YidC/SpoIIIJ protein YidD
MPKYITKNKFLYLFFFFILVKDGLSQTAEDMKLVEEKVLEIPEYEHQRKVTYLFKDKNIFVKYNPVSIFFGGLLYLYQKYISVQIGANCPYEISCSNFSKQCISKYGLLYGIPLTADRLTRCTRAASYDLIRGVEYNSVTNKIYDHPDDYSFRKK